MELEDRRALGAERALVVRTARVAFDVDDLAVDGVDQRGAADRAVGTDARRGLGSFNAEFLGASDSRARFTPEPTRPLSAVPVPAAKEKRRKSRRETSMA